ncbi:hypothetical protein AB0I00_32980 [Streptomyces sp. NPDC050803]|uniref:hypothetical protein n=1 Tax=unclassified Streptomyces TaxID=2593676 RepID=UPI00341B0592
MLKGIGRESHTEVQARLLQAFRAQQNTTIATSDGQNQRYGDAAAALAGLNLLTLASALGYVKNSSDIDQTLKAIADGLECDARKTLPDSSQTYTDARLEGIDQLLRADYARLHEAMWAHDNAATRP